MAEYTVRWGGEQVVGSTSPLTKGKRGRERDTIDAHYAEWESTSCVILFFTYSVRKTSSSFSSRLMHGSICSVFFTTTQSVKRRMLSWRCTNMFTFPDLIPVRGASRPGSIAMIAFLHSSIFCASFGSTWCSFRSLRNQSMHLGLGIRGFFLPTLIVGISLATLFLFVSGTGRSEYQRRTRLYGFSRHLILSPKDNSVARGGNAIIRASHSSAPVPRRARFNSHSREATTYPFS